MSFDSKILLNKLQKSTRLFNKMCHLFGISLPIDTDYNKKQKIYNFCVFLILLFTVIRLTIYLTFNADNLQQLKILLIIGDTSAFWGINRKLVLFAIIIGLISTIINCLLFNISSPENFKWKIIFEFFKCDTELFLKTSNNILFNNLILNNCECIKKMSKHFNNLVHILVIIIILTIIFKLTHYI